MNEPRITNRALLYAFFGAVVGHTIGVLIGYAFDGGQELIAAWQTVIRFAPGVLAGMGAVVGLKLSAREE